MELRADIVAAERRLDPNDARPTNSSPGLDRLPDLSAQVRAASVEVKGQT